MTIDVPAIPVKLTLGRNQESTGEMLVPANKDNKEVAIVCLGSALLFATLAVIALASER
jgi:hypothetical protein